MSNGTGPVYGGLLRRNPPDTPHRRHNVDVPAKRDTGFGECPECGSTSVVPIGRQPHPLWLLSPILTGARAAIARDLLCNECGARWPLADAELADPWAGTERRFPHTPADDVDEDALDDKWAQRAQDD
jgi:hypothetical protein